jgi:hypothetical protein
LKIGDSPAGLLDGPTNFESENFAVTITQIG